MLTLTGCDSFSKQTADAWAVTYEIEVQGTSTELIGAVSYDKAPSRGEDSSSVTAGDVSTTKLADSKDSAVWKVEAQVTAQKRAAVTGTAQPGSIASCRILLDGVREISKNTAKPGEPVSCSADTPAFQKK